MTYTRKDGQSPVVVLPVTLALVPSSVCCIWFPFFLLILSVVYVSQSLLPPTWCLLSRDHATGENSIGTSCKDMRIWLTYLLSKRQNQNATTKILSSIFGKVEPRNSPEKNKRNSFALQLSKAPRIWPKNEVDQRAKELDHVKVNSYHNTAFQHHKQIEWFTVHVTK